eukprot:TRINITY_DN2230_c0_g1_i1.p1 TRINITY_DN2230_c0_g1~~TRINITY_DN2230_c0_g1_i1.p1  ORF type:complete len:271 (-),score=68.97 TRINITY_DN2230_c0_g1_i1:89-814(-)
MEREKKERDRIGYDQWRAKRDETLWNEKLETTGTLDEQLSSYSIKRTELREQRRRENRELSENARKWEQQKDSYFYEEKKREQELMLQERFEREEKWNKLDLKKKHLKEDRERYREARWRREKERANASVQRNADSILERENENATLIHLATTYKRRKEIEDKKQMRQRARIYHVLDLDCPVVVDDDSKRRVTELRRKNRRAAHQGSLKDRIQKEEKEMQKMNQWYSDRRYYRRESARIRR